jgi:hypothetical protein
MYMFPFKKTKCQLFDVTVNVEKNKKISRFVLFFLNHCTASFVY